VRSLLAAATVFVLGSQALPAAAGQPGADGAVLSCAVLAGQTALPAGICQPVAAAFFRSASRIDLAALATPDLAGSLPVLPMAASGSPMAPGAALNTSSAWQAQLDRGVASYRQIFGGRNLAYAVPAVPYSLWPGGNPFATDATD
jgi:hypothetical protein